MIKTIMSSIVLMAAISSTALADNSVGTDYSSKQKVGVGEHHDVYGVTYGTNVSNNLSFEGRMEDEVVHDPAKHEGLIQAKLSYDIINLDGFKPYVAGAFGQKSKATSNFGYYVVEGGVKYSPISNVDLKLARRLRTPWSESNSGTGDKYRTVENSATAGLRLGKNTLSVKYARERGDSNYNTIGVGINHKF